MGGPTGPTAGADWTTAALLEGLDSAQREAVLTDASPLVILAPAGSGKTRVVSHRIARRVLDGSADAQHVLAITFTRRAAGELQRRLGRLGLRGRPTAGTFHGVAWAVLTQRWSDQRRARPDLLTDRVRVLEMVVGQVVPTWRVASVRVDAVASELDWARARLVSPERYAEEARRGGRKPPLPPDLLAEVFTAYADQKRKRRVVDFDDLLELCAAELDHQPDFAASQRWRFRHLFVDEFQDVNPLQFHLLEAWRGGRPDLCVVGDPNQAIYGWNGADPSLLLRLPSLVGGATVVRLDRSYRSTPQVLTTAAALLPDGEAPAAVRADGPEPEVHGFATEHDEARAIAALRGGAPAGPAVVVVRGAGPHPGPGGPHRARPARTPRSRCACGTIDRCSTSPACRRRCARATTRSRSATSSRSSSTGWRPAPPRPRPARPSPPGCASCARSGASC